MNTEFSLKQKINKPNDKICEFIVKMLQMMKNHPDIVHWDQQGTQIIFGDLTKLLSEVIPKYFRHRNLLSFIRQLNMYYFSKIESKGKDEMIFKHDIFLRGNDKNFHTIQRRNKIRDQIFANLEIKYEETLKYIKCRQNINDEAKNLLVSAIQYQMICLGNYKRIKSHIEDLAKQLKTVRGKKIKQSLQKLKQTCLPELSRLTSKIKELEEIIKKQLCRDFQEQSTKNLPNFTSNNQLILLQDLRSNRDFLPIYAARSFKMPSVNSLIGRNSQCSLGQELQEHQQLNQQASIGQDLKFNSPVRYQQ